MGARYSRQTGYTISKRQPARSTVRTVQRRIKFGPTTAKFFGFAILAIFALIMLTQSGTSTTTVYQQNAIREQTSKANQDIEALQLEAQRAQSLQEIQNTPVKDQMQPVDQVNYVEKGQVAGVSTQR